MELCPQYFGVWSTKIFPYSTDRTVFIIQTHAATVAISISLQKFVSISSQGPIQDETIQLRLSNSKKVNPCVDRYITDLVCFISKTIKVNMARVKLFLGQVNIAGTRI